MRKASMSKKKTPKTEMKLALVGKDPCKVEQSQWLMNVFSGNADITLPNNLAVIYITQSISHSDWIVSQSLPWEDRRISDKPNRILVVWDCVPIHALHLVDWKDFLGSNLKLDHTILICPHSISNLEEFQGWFLGQLKMWQPETCAPEETALSLGDHVLIPQKTSPELLSAAYISLSFGITQERLELLEYWRRRFLEQIECVNEGAREELHRHLGPALRKREESNDELDWEIQEKIEKELQDYISKAGFPLIYPSALPVILLTGESGCGKTMIAKHLSRSINGQNLPFAPVPVTQFESSEHMLEYDLFGFRGGTYSDAPPKGEPGILLNHICGIIFLDEIGDASPATQRKLLTYLDDYCVRPKGIHNPIFCPTLVIGATNHDLNQEVEDGIFRRDLFERFDVHVEVPSLNNRKVDFRFIIDEILQNPGINPGQLIKSVGKIAYDYLINIDYTNGNFRRLESLLQFGIREATKAGRSIILISDLENWKTKSAN